MIPRSLLVEHPGLIRRSQAFLVALFAGFAALGVLGATETSFRPGWSDGALMWWPEPGAGSGWLAISLVISVILAFTRPGLFLGWRRAASLAVLLTVGAVVGDVLIAGRPGVAVWPDRIESRALTRREVIVPADMRGIEVSCSAQRQWRPRLWRPPSVAQVGYAVVGPSGERFDLTRGQTVSRVADLAWLNSVDRLDRLWTDAGVERRVAADEHGIERRRSHCVRRLPASLGEDGFTQARRLLAINDQTLRDFGMETVGGGD